MIKDIKFFIKKYLENRPMFLSIIRSQEAIFFEKHKKLIKSPILDFGCGDGFFAETVFGKGKIDIGLDLKNSRALTAKKNNVYKEVVYYKGLKIPFSNNYFSVVISNCVLEHLPKLSKNLKEINRVLKPEGYFITSVMTNNWNDYLFGKNIFRSKYINYMKKRQEHFNLLTEKQWNNIFIKNGFKIVKTIPYMSKKQSPAMDIAHYLSFPSLITYRLFKKWVLVPKWYKYLFADKIIFNLVSKNDIKNGAALFYILKNENRKKSY